jgi:catalase
MHGFSSHTYKWVNEKGEGFYVKYQFKTAAGIKNLTDKEAAKLSGSSKDYATEDLYNHIA